jgi:hypothetical protein
MRGSTWLCLAMLAAANVPAATTVEVLESYPEGDRVTLAQGQNYYLRLQYEADAPVKIWARPFHRGKPADAGSHPSQSHTGSGETLGWFFFPDARGAVDEIRILVGDGSRDGTAVALSYPMDIVAGAGRVSRAGEPEWVARLQAVDAERQRAAFEAAASQPASAGASVFMIFFMLGMLALGAAGLVLPIRAFAKWRGGWRMAAAVPAAMMGFVVLRIIIGVAIDPTSHNLWPFEILSVGFISVIVMALLMLLRRTSKARET